jgi:hypothetical protein
MLQDKLNNSSGVEVTDLNYWSALFHAAVIRNRLINSVNLNACAAILKGYYELTTRDQGSENLHNA